MRTIRTFETLSIEEIPLIEATRKRRIDKLIIHCSAVGPNQTSSARQIDAWHRANGWDMIGYHYVIRRDGSIEIGRPADKVGAHCKGQNSYSLGICYEGGMASQLAASPLPSPKERGIMDSKANENMSQQQSTTPTTASPPTASPLPSPKERGIIDSNANENMSQQQSTAPTTLSKSPPLGGGREGPPGGPSVPADTRTPEQKATLLALLRHLKMLYPNAEIHGHKEFARKACPCFDANNEYTGL